MKNTKPLKNKNKYADGGSVSYSKDLGFGTNYNPSNEYTYGMGPQKDYGFGTSSNNPNSLINVVQGLGIKPSSLSDKNPYSKLETPLENTKFSNLSKKTRDYINVKMGYDLGNQAKYYGDDSALWNVNHLLMTKGASPIKDWSQIDQAMVPLIKKREKRGLSGALGIIAPVALSFLAPGIGTALGGALGATAGSAGMLAAQTAVGAGLGALGSGITGGNVGLGALLGGAGGAFNGLRGATAGQVLAKSGPLAGTMVTPTAAIGPSLPVSMMQPNFAQRAMGSIRGLTSGGNGSLLDRLGQLGRVGNIVGQLGGQQEQEQPQQMSPQLQLLIAQLIAEARQNKNGFRSLVGYANGGIIPNGRLVKGQGDGMSDSIMTTIDGQAPAALSSGEHVVPSLQVAMLGRGDNEAGSAKVEEIVQKELKKLYGKNTDVKALQERAMNRNKKNG